MHFIFCNPFKLIAVSYVLLHHWSCLLSHTPNIYTQSSVTVIQNLTSNSAVNVRFAQLQPTDTKFQVLRQQMVRANTKNLVYHCRGDQLDCSAALARMRYKASKHFYALAKAVVDYVKNRRQARPTGYVGEVMEMILK